jgi:LacI family transcriptional regulator, galactose operon repressor
MKVVEQDEDRTAERRMPNLYDVARLAGVSTSTASRVLAGSRPVRPEVRKRVLESAAALDYSTNLHARALARSHDASIGVVVHDVNDPYFSEIVRGVLEGAEASNQWVFISNTYRDVERELEYIRRYRAQRVKAVVLAGSGRLDRDAESRLNAEVSSFERTGGRAVLVGRHEVAGDSVAPDNRGGARQAAAHLLQLGHRRLGVIAGPRELTTSVDRLSGFREELAAQGVDLPDKQVKEGRFNRAQAEEATDALLTAAPRLTGIFAVNDIMAIGVLACLRKRGARVPEDVSVVGFDDIPVAADLVPALTTVRVPMAEMGRRAFVLALEPAAPRFRTEQLPTELVVRESTGKARR